MREFIHRLRDLLEGSSILNFSSSEERLIAASSNGAHMQGRGTLPRWHSLAELISKSSASPGVCPKNPLLSLEAGEVLMIIGLLRNDISNSRRGYTPDMTEEPYVSVTDSVILGRSLLLMYGETPTAIGSGAVVGSKGDDSLNFPQIYRFGVMSLVRAMPWNRKLTGSASIGVSVERSWSKACGGGESPITVW